MAVEIGDGSGFDYRAKVDSRNRIFTDSISREQLEYAILTGNGYNVSTGNITLTTDGNSAIGWFKYTGKFALVIKEILVILGASTNGTGNGTITILKNPTTGTIISNAVPVSAASNRDFSSFNQLPALAYKGAEGDTFTDGDTFAVTGRDGSAQIVSFDAAPIVLKKGNSIGIKYTPPSGNTSQNVIVAGTVYEEKVEI
jgi:hypothetical protein